MKNTTWAALAAALALLFTFCKTQKKAMPTPAPGPAMTVWQKIDSLDQAGQPRSALELLGPELAKARASGNPGELVKALILRAKFETMLDENGLTTAAQNFLKEAEAAAMPEKAVLESLAAEMLTTYLSNQQWRIRQRTDGGAAFSQADLSTWAVADFEREAQRLYAASVGQPEVLKKIQLPDFQSIIVKGVADSIGGQPLRPTLFDLLGQRAIGFFENESNYLTEPENRFRLSQPEAFAPFRTFITADFSTKDTASRKAQAVRIFQKILAAHEADANPGARVVADLQRLSFARNNSTLDDREERYLNALTTLQRQVAGQPAEAEVGLALSSYWHSKGHEFDPARGEKGRYDWKTAHDIAADVVKRFPGEQAASGCKSLIANVLTRETMPQVEEVSLPGRAILMGLNYRNLSLAHLRIVRWSMALEEEFGQLPDDAARGAFLKKQAALNTFSQQLTTPGDYRNHFAELRLPALPIGHYAVQTADNEAFAFDGKTQFALTRFHVSNMACTIEQEEGAAAVWVADRATGAPIAGARAEFWHVEHQWRQDGTHFLKKEKLGEAVTGADGRAAFAGPENRGVEVLLVNGRDSLPGNSLYLQKHPPGAGHNEARLFTDRAIYRPGQTVFFKGIVLHNDGHGRPRLLPGETVTAAFYDANHQKINELRLRSNEFGSFNGSFAAPTGGLTGGMFINAMLDGNRGGGAVHFSVEEYKRPRFEAKFLPIEGGYRLGEAVTATGEAMNLAGSALDGAAVKWRVVRNARPVYDWFGWGKIWPGAQPDQEIAHGETTTDADGKFKINFTANADPDFEKDRETVVYDYSLTADVTDAAGETRTATYSLSMSYVSMVVELGLPERVPLDSLKGIKISTRNLNGQPVAAKGRLVAQPVVRPFFKNRYWQKPDVWTLSEDEYRREFPGLSFKEEDDPKNWKTADYLIGDDWETGTSKPSGPRPSPANPAAVNFLEKNMGGGLYRFTLTTTDPATGKEIKVEKTVEVFDRKAKEPPTAGPFFTELDRAQVEPGESARLYLGATGEANFLVKITRPRDPKPAKWFKINGLQAILIEAAEADRGTTIGITVASVRDNRAFHATHAITVPWSDKELTIEYATFRDKLAPGQPEEWRLKILGPKKEKIAAEVLASMYDASLDQFRQEGWRGRFWYLHAASHQLVAGQFGSAYGHQWGGAGYDGAGGDRRFPELDWFGFPMYVGYGYGMGGGMPRVMSAQMRTGAENYYIDGIRVDAAAAPMAEMALSSEKAMAKDEVRTLSPDEPGGPAGDPGGGKPATSGPAPRQNLNETVFFFPELRTDAEGNVIVKFTMNEALTRWKFRALAHTKELATALTEREVVTQKELMVLPNPPRFLRAGDEVEFVSKVSNLSEKDLKGTASIQLTDAISGRDVTDRFFENYFKSPVQQPFSVEKGRSAAIAWRLKVPEAMTEPVMWRITATSGQFSDGEENMLPVVTNRMLLTESVAMSVRGGQAKNFELKSLVENSSRTAKNHGFTLEFTPNPAWYAVQSLPYLMEYPHECTEQVMSRLFANALASSVANSNPKIKAVFDRWKADGKALASNLAKNQELKTALLEETPWVMAAQSEEQQRQQIALLFDLNKMGDERARAIRQLVERQQGDGGFPWFSGGPSDWFITQNVVGDFLRLQKLGAIKFGGDEPEMGMVSNALTFCDRKAVEAMERAKKQISEKKEAADGDYLDPLAAHWLYVRSFGTISQVPLDAMTFFVAQAEKHWQKKGLQEQAMLAVALKRFERDAAARAITRSLRERAQQSEELGMYWNFAPGFYWYDLPIETQAFMIEAFLEVENDAQSVDNQRVWLLKNKQTNRWESTKATAAAVYALLIGNSKWLDDTKPVSIKIGGRTLDQSDAKPEPGTGYFKKAWPGTAVKNDFGKIEVSNPNPGIAWGAAYWQYWEDMDKVKGFRETPLKVSKSLFKIERTAAGEKLVAAENLKPGDRLKVRLELKTDRPMEYLHLKDARAAGFEPVDVLSGYHWADGLGYYQSTRDLATHFFISYMPKGTYIIEYQLVVQQRGDFSGGVSTLQCMYAPEFSSHSTGGRVKVN